MIHVSLNKLNRLWKNGILPKLNEKVDNAKVLSNIEEIEANTDASNIAGALALKEVNNDLGGLSFAQDAEGNWGYKPSGADTVIPFSSGNAIYLGIGNTFDIKAIYSDWTNLTVNNFICGCKTVTASSYSNGKPATAGNISVSRNVTANYQNGVLRINSVSGQSIDASTTRDVSVSANNYFALLLLPT